MIAMDGHAISRLSQALATDLVMMHCDTEAYINYCGVMQCGIECLSGAMLAAHGAGSVIGTLLATWFLSYPEDLKSNV